MNQPTRHSSSPRSGSSRRDSSRSRSRKKRRSKSSEIERSPKTVAKDGVDFLFLLIGFTFSSTLLLILWAKLQPPKPSAPLTDLVSTEKLTNEELRASLENRSPRQLREDLTRITEQLPTLNSIAKVNANKQRVAIANRLIGRKMSDAQRRECVTAKIEALLGLVLANIRLLEEKRDPVTVPPEGRRPEDLLRETCQLFRDDRDLEISILARAALINVRARDPAQDVTEIADEVLHLIKRFPNEARSVGVAQAVMKLYFQESNRRYAGGQLAKIIADATMPQSDLNLGRLQADCRDYAALVDSGFYEAVDTREISGQQGVQNLRNILMDLSSNPLAGDVILERVNTISTWLEDRNEVQAARDIYSTLLANADKFSTAGIPQKARQLGQQGLQRCNAFGAPFEFAGTVYPNQSISSDQMDGRIGIVVFWSLDNDASVSMLKIINEECKNWSGSPYQVIAVCLDDLNSETFQQQDLGKLAESVGDNWWLVVRDQDGNLPILEHFPVSKLPWVVLTNKQRELVDLHLSASEIGTQVDLLLYE